MGVCVCVFDTQTHVVTSYLTQMHTLQTLLSKTKMCQKSFPATPPRPGPSPLTALGEGKRDSMDEGESKVVTK